MQQVYLFISNGLKNRTMDKTDTVQMKDGSAIKGVQAGTVAKWLGIGFLAIAFILAAYFVAKYFINKAKKTTSNKSVNEAEKEIKKSDLSYAESEYTSMADRLFQAMNGPGSTDSTIYEILNKLKNSNDWNKLVVEFGTRESTYTVWPLKAFKGNLVEWLQDELDEDELKQTGEILTKINVKVF